jgi:hypothetical protein
LGRDDKKKLSKKAREENAKGKKKNEKEKEWITMLPAHKKRKNVRPFPSSLGIKSRALWSVKNFLINSPIFHRKIKSSQRANEEPLVVHRRTTPPSFFWSGMLTIILRWS